MIARALALALLAGAAARALAPVALPGAEGGVGFDDLRYSGVLRRVLVPAGRTGRLDLVDPGSGTVEAIEGFTRSAPGRRGHGDGTTSADAGAPWVFAIDRGDDTVAVVDPAARRVVAKAKLAGGPDYVRWVDGAREVWVTEPDRGAIEVFRLDGGAAPRLTRTASIDVPGGPESLVVDAARGRAYTNTFGDATVAIDVRAHAVAARWSNGCRGARGIDLDAERAWVFVGCAEGRVVALDAARGGATTGEARVGAGVDGIAYAPGLAHLYAPGARAGTTAVVAVGGRGELEPLGDLPAAPDAHCAAADDEGRVFVCDPRGGRLLVLRDPYPSSGQRAR